MTGLLTGLRFPDINSILKCINNIPDITDKLNQIIYLLEHLDLRHIQDIVKAF